MKEVVPLGSGPAPFWGVQHFQVLFCPGAAVEASSYPLHITNERIYTHVTG
jgi:hypothetical protein